MDSFLIIRRLRAKHESEMCEVENELSECRQKLQRSKNELAKAEEEGIVLKAEAKQKDVVLEELKTVGTNDFCFFENA